MPNPPVVVVVKVTKPPVIGESAAKQVNGKTVPGTTYLRMSLVEDTADGAKWYDGVAFGSMAKLLNQKLSKGTEFKAVGRLTIKEWEKDGRTGTNNNLVIDKAIFDGGDEVDRYTKFTEPQPPPF